MTELRTRDPVAPDWNTRLPPARARLRFWRVKFGLLTTIESLVLTAGNSDAAMAGLPRMVKFPPVAFRAVPMVALLMEPGIEPHSISITLPEASPAGFRAAERVWKLVTSSAAALKGTMNRLFSTVRSSTDSSRGRKRGWRDRDVERVNQFMGDLAAVEKWKPIGWRTPCRRSDQPNDRAMVGP